MVAFNQNRKQRGGSVLDSLLSPFTVRKYGNESHSRSLDPHHFLQGYTYVGPGTEVKLREQLHDNKPFNKLDEAAKDHDYLYMNEKEAYERDHDKQKHINNIWHGDEVFINRARSQRDDPIVGKLAAKLIQTKENLEKANLLDTRKFEGFGNDPAARSSKMVYIKYYKKKKKTIQQGGILPVVAAIGTAAASVLAKRNFLKTYMIM